MSKVIPKLREQLKYRNYSMPGILTNGHYYAVIRTGCTVNYNHQVYFVEVMGDTGYKRVFGVDNLWDYFDKNLYMMDCLNRERYLKLKNIFVHQKEYE